MDVIYSAVKNIIIFLLLVTVFMNLLGKSSFKQYISIFVGLVLIIIVIQPLLVLFNASDKVDHYFNLNLYQTNVTDISNELYNAEGKYKEKVVQEYKETIKQQIVSTLTKHSLKEDKIEVTIVEDTAATNCGEITALNVVARSAKPEQDVETSVEEVTDVDKVVIDKVNINTPKKEGEGGKKENTEDTYDTLLEITVKQELSALYGLDMSSISVEIKEG